MVPACEADAQRVERGEDPEAREVLVGGRRMPYWSAGPMYAPFAGGLFGGFGGGLFPGLMVGTLLGSSLGGWGMGDAYASAATGEAAATSVAATSAAAATSAEAAATSAAATSSARRRPRPHPAHRGVDPRALALDGLDVEPRPGHPPVADAGHDHARPCRARCRPRACRASAIRSTRRRPRRPRAPAPPGSRACSRRSRTSSGGPGRCPRNARSGCAGCSLVVVLVEARHERVDVARVHRREEPLRHDRRRRPCARAYARPGRGARAASRARRRSRGPRRRRPAA